MELTLKSKAAGGWKNLADLEEGQVLRGRVKRVEKYGVFVDIAGSSLTGLAHISEVADAFVQDIAKLFNPGQGKPSDELHDVH